MVPLYYDTPYAAGLHGDAAGVSGIKRTHPKVSETSFPIGTTGIGKLKATSRNSDRKKRNARARTQGAQSL